MIRYLFIALLSLFFIECNQSICGSEVSPTTSIGFFDTTNTASIDSTFDKISIQALNTNITDSVLIYQQKLSSIKIPLNINTDTSYYLLTINNIKDTLTFYYEKSIYSRSTNCEFLTNFKLKNVTHKKTDLYTIDIQNPIVEDLEKTTTNETNPTYHIHFNF